MTDTDYTDDLALLANTSLLQSLEQVEGGIDLNMNANKTEYISGKLLKLLDQFTYLSSIISFTIFTNPSAQARYDTGSIFTRSLTGLNSEFSFS